MRLDRYVSLCLKKKTKEAQQLIREGKIMVENEVITSHGWQVFVEFEQVLFENTPLPSPISQQLYILHKPVGYLSESNLRTKLSEKNDPQNNNELYVTDLLPEEFRTASNTLSMFGRLDKNTSGLLLFGNDPGLIPLLLHPTKHVQKTYIVKVDNSLSDDVIKELEEGVTLQDGIKCLPATIVKLPENIDSNGNQFYNYEITIREGMYHQIKKMMRVFNLKVIELHRISFGDLYLDDNLKAGEIRLLTKEELLKVLKMLPKIRTPPKEWKTGELKRIPINGNQNQSQNQQNENEGISQNESEKDNGKQKKRKVEMDSL